MAAIMIAADMIIACVMMNIRFVKKISTENI